MRHKQDVWITNDPQDRNDAKIAKVAHQAVIKGRSLMADKLIDIEGIGTTYAKTLEEAGLTNTDHLLETAGSAAGRRKLAESTGVSEKLILEWVNRADLMRINGVGSEFSDLLESSGVDTVKELATRVPANLQAKMAEVNEAKKLTRRTPNLAEVEKWVAEAKTMKAMVSH
jgi:predicted flap endonuclease-1-like 5' DNA nuclease